VKPLCDLLTVFDAKLLLVALEGIESILKTGALQAEGTKAAISSQNMLRKLEVWIKLKHYKLTRKG